MWVNWPPEFCTPSASTTSPHVLWTYHEYYLQTWNEPRIRILDIRTEQECCNHPTSPTLCTYYHIYWYMEADDSENITPLNLPSTLTPSSASHPCCAWCRVIHSNSPKADVDGPPYTKGQYCLKNVRKGKWPVSGCHPNWAPFRSTRSWWFLAVTRSHHMHIIYICLLTGFSTQCEHVSKVQRRPKTSWPVTGWVQYKRSCDLISVARALRAAQLLTFSVCLGRTE